jgi:hypothetical protein
MHSMVGQIGHSAKPSAERSPDSSRDRALAEELVRVAPKDNRTIRRLEARSLAFMRLTGLELKSTTASFNAVHNPFL